MRTRASVLWAIALAAAVPSSGRAAIVYSGSQNVTLALSPMSPMDSKIIELGGMAEDWDDFRVDLWLDMGTMTMSGMGSSMAMAGMGTHLAIYAPMSMAVGMDMGVGMGTGMGGILGLRTLVLNNPMGGAIGGDSFFDVFLDVSLPDQGGEFGEGGGYIGLQTAMGQYGWVHMLTGVHRVVFDEWAYEDRPGVPIAAGQGRTCDWVRARPHKMHWPQLPDLGPTGVDIGLSRTALGDDFRCTETGPIRSVHIWGSFQDDLLPKGGPDSLTLQVSLYSDIPATATHGSRPGSLLWARVFKQGEYTARKVHDGPEDWYDPVTGRYLPANHRQAFQYNFCIGQDPFPQLQGTIYWLVVQDLSTSADYGFGWKTTSPRSGWNDDAACLPSEHAGWTAMTYPKGHSYEGRTLDLAFVVAGDDSSPEFDLGDAPDSSNSAAGTTMLAYPSGVLGHFPTVYQAGSPPFGPLHRHPRDLFFLGSRVSLETEADIGPDEDGLNNLGPAAVLGADSWTARPGAALDDVAPRDLAADRDGADDGLHLPVVLPFTGWQTTVDYDVTSVDPQPIRAYVNIFFDLNRDGDWDDLLVSPDGNHEPEWAVQNQVVSLPGAGVFTFTSPSFNASHLVTDTGDPLWARITLAERQHLPSIVLVDAAPGYEGAGPADGYEYGETEDYSIRPRIGPPDAKYDWGDAPETAAAAGYPTWLASNGARHRPVGPWFGDDGDRPDSEPDGQPDPHALGDDTNGSNDENGVSIPPLVRGHLASATIVVNGGGGMVRGWVDFNADRVWQAAERVFDGFLPDGAHVVPFSVPNSAAVGQTFARFRISRQGGLGPSGPALDGEVEDHEVAIDPPLTEDKTWCQPPDLTMQGIDVRVDWSDGRTRILADDFACRTPGQLTAIRLWGSWRADRKGEIKKIRVAIRPDDPVGSDGADTKNTFSQPGPETLWEQDFQPGQFEEKLRSEVPRPGEWWWDPTVDKASPGGDTQVWQIDMNVGSAHTFKQDGTADHPRIYWLVVEVQTADGEFGWKTRQWPEHFMDDAVWTRESRASATWHELRYPLGHPYSDSGHNSIDLAFCLMFSTETPPATILPGTVTACPAVETTCPAVETECPATETRCPAVETQCPAEQTLCPVVFTGCPATETRCPAIYTQCPESLTKCPPVDTQCPVEKTVCPVAFTECPATETRCPLIETKCPAEDTKCPPVDTQCPAEQTACPVVSTECPVRETHCPPIQTYCPPLQTLCSPTQCPDQPTQCTGQPTICPADTQCPPVDTECPPVDTQCPPVDTRCPQIDTQCPPWCPVTVYPTCPVTIYPTCPVTIYPFCPGALDPYAGQSDSRQSVYAARTLEVCPIVEADCPSL